MERPTFKQNTWTDGRRDDGTEVYLDHGRWIIISPCHPPMSTCPCCNKAFTKPEYAQSAADAYFPVNPGESGWIDAEGKPILDVVSGLLRRLAAKANDQT